MDNEQIHEKLSAMLDGELPGQERQALETRLAEDPALAREWERMQRMDRLFRDLPAQAAPPDLTVPVDAGRSRGTVSFKRPLAARRAVWPLLAAAAVFFVVIGWAVVRFPGDRGAFPMASAPEAAEEAAAPADAVVGERAEYGSKARQFKTAPSRASGMTPSSKDGAEPSVADELGDVQSAPVPPPPPAPPARRRQEQPQGGIMAGQRVEAEAHVEAPDTSGGGYGRGAKTETSGRRAGYGGAAPSAAPAEDKEALSEERSVPESKRMAGREFRKDGSRWIQAGYEGQEAASLARDSDAWGALLSKEPALADLAELRGEVVFRIDDGWRRLLPVESGETPEDGGE